MFLKVLPRVQGTVIDDGGRERNFFFQAVVVPRMGANLFSVTEALWKGLSKSFTRTSPGWSLTTLFYRLTF